jgi:glycosyltransferase involved in cell wall biosynthesis
MRELRSALRDLIPTPLRERYHRHAVLRDFGINLENGSRRQTLVDPRISRGLNLIGYFDSPSGIGESARSLARAAEEHGVPLARMEASASIRKTRLQEAYDVNLFHVNADAAASVVEQMGPALHSGRANIGYWYWESDRFPEFWRDRFAYFDEIWVASDFCRKSIQAASPIPVELVPPAVLVRGRSGARSRIGIDTSDFLFLTILDALSVVERKNPIATIQAFSRAFSQTPSARLHVQLANGEQVPGLLSALEEAGRPGRVRISNALLSREGIEDLLSSCDAYVSLHRAEGFGFPIAEAMALGKPVIATDYSGNTDYLNESTGFPVRGKRMTLSERVRDYGPGTQWAEPDTEHAIALLRQVYEDREEARRRGESARRRIAELFGSQVVAGRINASLARLRERLKKIA